MKKEFSINDKVELTKGELVKLLNYSHSVSSKHRNFAYVIDSFLDIQNYTATLVFNVKQIEL